MFSPSGFVFRVVRGVESRPIPATLHVLFRLAHANRPRLNGRVLLVLVDLLRNVTEGEVITFRKMLTVLVDEFLQTADIFNVDIAHLELGTRWEERAWKSKSERRIGCQHASVCVRRV